MKTITKLFIYGYLFSLAFVFSSYQDAYSVEREKVLYYNDIDGLPRNIVTCVEQDKYGYTWIGTGNGIARFDGHTFYTYNSLKGYNINYLYVDTQNRLWVTCDEGFFTYNRLTNEFELIRDGYARKTIVHDNKVYVGAADRILNINNTEASDVIVIPDLWDFYIEEDGIWASNATDGVRFYTAESNYKTITKEYLNGKQVSLIRKIDDKLFFACRKGQLFVLTNNKDLSKVSIEGYPAIMEIIKVDDEIWLATDGNGIIILDNEANYKRTIRKNSNQSSKLNSNSIYDIYLGDNNEVWIGTYSAGLVCLQVNNSPFKNIVPEARNRNSLIDKEGTAVFIKNNRIYFGTNYGMSVLNETNGKFTNYSLSSFWKDIKGKKILAINKDGSDNIWIGTYGGLLGKYNSDMELIDSYHPCSTNPNEMQRIALLYSYSATNMIIGTHYRAKSLLNFNLQTGEAVPFTLSFGGDQQSNFLLNSVKKNKNGETLALIRNAGIFKVNINNNTLDNELPEINKRITFRLNDFYHDKNDFYWLATQKDGLVRMSKDGLHFDKWGTEQGLPSVTLLRLESVDDRYLWISTISGLCRFDMKTEQMLVFNHRHGLPANEFMQRTSIVTDDGRLIFGSNAGFTIVDPDKVQTDISKSEVIISDITFQNQSIKSISEEPILEVPLEETKNIALPFNKNSFTIHFFAKDKDLPKYNNYAYRLLGFEDEWIFLGENKQTTYTNLSPGTYTFEVKSTNKSNVWNNTPTQLTIKIIPPWYFTWYAFAAYLVFLFALVFGSLFAYTNRVRLKKEVEISEFEVQKEHELTERKLAFFTNISHDLKTPLTLIDAPVHDLLETDNLSESDKSKLLIIKRNSQRLYKLITDILDFRKLTQKQMPLKVSESKIGDVIKNIYEAFKAECDKKHIDFGVHISVNEAIWVEVKKIEKILWNLLSNAIKFTDAEGEIYLSAEKEIKDNSNYLKLIVKDSGIGIPNEEKTNIFKRFYQKRDGAKRQSEGTGIGLSIVKELVELHHGTIELDSTLGVGSTFTILIPTDKTEYTENEIDSFNKETVEQNQLEVPVLEENLLTSENKSNNYNLPVLLLVEDNVELREYMSGYFGKNYKVYQAEDGVDGLEMVKRKKPDIIITDILMPNMDGHEFCKTIRSNFETSHIPLLMLTANGMVEQQIEGLSEGADAYVTKPFDIKYLGTLTHSILENRKKIRNRILGTAENGKYDNKLTVKDVDFVDELRLCIQNNISNQHLNVELLSEHFAISRTQLNRKIKSLTGQTPNNLIKSVRLKMAYELIREKGLRVSEAAYQTGFSDPNYFTICFKKEFGENPSKISHQ